MPGNDVSAFLYVQHLHGIGHMARTQRIARSLLDAGVHTSIIQGGAETGLPAVPGVHMHSLAPVRVTSEDMETLLHDDGSLFTDADRAKRRDALLDLLHRLRPDILVIEAFPFGRRQLRFELIPLLEAARAMGVRLIASSIRDILRDKRKPGRAEETVEVIERYFDLVLVHGEESLTPLSKTFPLAHAFAHKTHYTGLVGPKAAEPAGAGLDIVVSAGGGVYGTSLIETAIRAAMAGAGRDRSWLVLAGQNMPEADFRRIGALIHAGTTNIDFRRSIPDLCSALSGAQVSVSYAGYNTVADILVAGCAAVLVPFVTPKENEQHDRTVSLAGAGRVVHLAQESLTPETLVKAISEAARLPAAQRASLDGGTRTARILLRELAKTAPCPTGTPMPALQS